MKDDLSGGLHKEKEKRVDLVAIPKECDKVNPIVIKQGVIREIKSGDDIVAYARVRSMEMPSGKIEYSFGIKNFQKNEESESKISKDTFEAFYPKNVDKPQVKSRYVLPNGWIVDKKDDGKIVAEFEYDKKSDIVAVPKDWKMSKSAMETYDADVVAKPKVMKPCSVDLPVIQSRDDAGEQGAQSQS